jgi:hypothetical protein
MKFSGWEDKGTQGAHEAWAERITKKEALDMLGWVARTWQAIDARHDAVEMRNQNTMRESEARSMTPPLVVCGWCGQGGDTCVCEPCERCNEMPWECDFIDHSDIEKAKAEIPCIHGDLECMDCLVVQP